MSVRACTPLLLFVDSDGDTCKAALIKNGLLVPERDQTAEKWLFCWGERSFMQKRTCDEALLLLTAWYSSCAWEQYNGVSLIWTLFAKLTRRSRSPGGCDVTTVCRSAERMARTLPDRLPL